MTDKPHTCHPLVGQAVEVVDVKRPEAFWRDCIGRTGVIHHDPTFGHDYLSFDDGGSADPSTEVIVAPADRLKHIDGVRG